MNNSGDLVDLAPHFLFAPSLLLYLMALGTKSKNLDDVREYIKVLAPWFKAEYLYASLPGNLADSNM